MRRSAAEISAPSHRSGLRSAFRAQSQPLTVRIYQSSEWSKVAPIWSRLEFLSPYASFYLTEDWISAWLEIFGASLGTRILVFEEQAQPVAACLLTSTVERRGPFWVSRMVLNTGAEPLPER